MFNVGMGEMLAILTLGLVVLGPERLPKVARQAGEHLRTAREMSSGFQQQFRDAMAMPDADVERETTPSP